MAEDKDKKDKKGPPDEKVADGQKGGKGTLDKLADLGEDFLGAEGRRVVQKYKIPLAQAALRLSPDSWRDPEGFIIRNLPRMAEIVDIGLQIPKISVLDWMGDQFQDMAQVIVDEAKKGGFAPADAKVPKPSDRYEPNADPVQEGYDRVTRVVTSDPSGELRDKHNLVIGKLGGVKNRLYEMASRMSDYDIATILRGSSDALVAMVISAPEQSKSLSYPKAFAAINADEGLKERLEDLGEYKDRFLQYLETHTLTIGAIRDLLNIPAEALVKHLKLDSNPVGQRVQEAIVGKTRQAATGLADAFDDGLQNLDRSTGGRTRQRARASLRSLQQQLEQERGRK